MKRIVRAAPVQVSGLAETHAKAFSHADCWQTPLLLGESRSPQKWVEAMFSGGPVWVTRLMSFRDALVRPLGLKVKVAGQSRFPVLSENDQEVLAGVPDSHLNFWVSTRIEDDLVSVTTYVKINSLLGRLYWSVVRFFHPVVVQSMLKGLGPVAK